MRVNSQSSGPTSNSREPPLAPSSFSFLSRGVMRDLVGGQYLCWVPECDPIAKGPSDDLIAFSVALSVQFQRYDRPRAPVARVSYIEVCSRRIAM